MIEIAIPVDLGCLAYVPVKELQYFFLVLVVSAEEVLPFAQFAALRKHAGAERRVQQLADAVRMKYLHGIGGGWFLDQYILSLDFSGNRSAIISVNVALPCLTLPLFVWDSVADALPYLTLNFKYID